MTKRYRLKYWILTIISLLTNVGPLGYYFIKSLIQTPSTYKKVTLCMMVFVVLIMTVIAVINKIAMRSRLWIILIGLYICLEYIMTPLIIIAICQIFDEIIISPWRSNIRTKLIIHKQIDVRI